jgi:hypothetical protein
MFTIFIRIVLYWAWLTLLTGEGFDADRKYGIVRKLLDTLSELEVTCEYGLLHRVGWGGGQFSMNSIHLKRHIG